MGVDARWICHTCKTMCCADGARSYLNYDLELEEAEKFLSYIEETYRKIFSGYHTEYLDSSELECLRSFTKWAKRHKDHSIQLTNDATVSRDDLPDYRAESVDGTINETPFGGELDLQYQYLIANHCPRCGAYVGDHPNREAITGVVKTEPEKPEQ